jgi:hypothetical protein
MSVRVQVILNEEEVTRFKSGVALLRRLEKQLKTVSYTFY